LADTDVSKVVVSAWFAAANPGDQPSDSQQALLDQISALLAVQPYLIDSTLAEARKEQGLIVSKPFSSPIDAQNWARGFPKGTSYAIFFDKDSGAWYAEAIVSPP
jgi:hypothetical protein